MFSVFHEADLQPQKNRKQRRLTHNKTRTINQKNRRVDREAKTRRLRGIRIDFKSFTEPEQLVLLKNFELDDKYRSRWTRDAILENKDLILKGNEIVIRRMMELFESAMPGA